jgi:hypothetical protein
MGIGLVLDLPNPLAVAPVGTACGSPAQSSDGYRDRLRTCSPGQNRSLVIRSEFRLLFRVG